jgi:hypothetical protein
VENRDQQSGQAVRPGTVEIPFGHQTHEQEKLLSKAYYFHEAFIFIHTDQHDT